MVSLPSLANAELVGAKTVKGADRPVSSPNAAPRAVNKVENLGHNDCRISNSTLVFGYLLSVART